MYEPTPGHVYALLTAIAWAGGVVLFRRAGEEIGPVALNVLKNVIALVLLVATLVVAGDVPLGEARWRDWALLVVSGAVGIGLSDTLFFRALNVLGAGRAAIVDCLYSPSVVLFSFVLLGERLSPAAALGAVLVVTAVLIAGHGRWSLETAHGTFGEGVALGAVAMVSMAVSIVAVKPILEREPVLWATTLRMTGGLAALACAALPTRAGRARFADALRPRPAWRWAVPGAVLGSYVALLLWIAGFKYAPASEVSILNQTSTVFVVLLAARFLDEPLTRRRAAAVALGIAGSVLAVA